MTIIGSWFFLGAGLIARFRRVVISETRVNRKLSGKMLAVAIASAVLLLIEHAEADILFTTGAMTPISAPVSFVEGATESSTSIAILDEGV